MDDASGDEDESVRGVPIVPTCTTTSSTTTTIASSDLERIRRSVLALAATDEMNKATALETTRLFHEMESLLHRECNERDRALSDTRSELERMRLQSELDRLARQKTLSDVQMQQMMSDAPRGRTTRR